VRSFEVRCDPVLEDEERRLSGSRRWPPLCGIIVSYLRRWVYEIVVRPCSLATKSDHARADFPILVFYLQVCRCTYNFDIEIFKIGSKLRGSVEGSPCPSEPFRATISPHYMPPSTLNSMGKMFIPPQPWNTQINISTPITNG
jgi:hypothetical protein